MNNNFCPKCGNSLVPNSRFCNSGGFSLEERTNVEQVDCSKKPKSVGETIGDVLRYIIGGFLILGGYINASEHSAYVLIIIAGLEIMPFMYLPFKNRINKGLYVLMQIVLPLSFIIICSVILNNGVSNPSNAIVNETDYIINKKTDAQLADEYIRKNIRSWEIVDNYHYNELSDKYDFDIMYYKRDIDNYDCAQESFELVGRLYSNNGKVLKTIGNINFICKSDEKRIFSVLYEDIWKGYGQKAIDIKSTYFDKNNKVVSKSLEQLFKDATKTHKWKDVMRNPEDYRGEKSYWFGQILQVVSKTSTKSEFRVGVDCKKYSYINEYLCDNTIYVTYNGSKSFIEDDMVKIWGTLDGDISYTSILGANITIPALESSYIDLVK